MAIQNYLIEAINKKGHITIAEMMEIALAAYPLSYYRNKNPLGEVGDFITAPEISQMFGEMIGVWVVDVWKQMGFPAEINLVELGPGQGALMRDLLNATKKSGLHNAIKEIILVDINQILIEQQEANLRNFNIPIKWHNDFSSLPARPTILIANEFFDALPIQQYVKEKEIWKELILKISPGNPNLIFDKITLNSELAEYFNCNYPQARDGAVIEESRVAADILKKIAMHLKTSSGSLLIIDYGYDIESKNRKASQFYPTLQAVKNHQYTPVLKDLGNADISAHVDFNLLKKLAEYYKLSTFGSLSQGTFLQNVGIDLRLHSLMRRNPHLSSILANQYKRLVSPNEMGELFKVLCISHLSNYNPLGF